MAAAEQFSLRWNNFQSNMTSGFHALWEGEDLVDVTLAADGRFLQAHKVVLSVCSPYFKTLFKVNPCKHPIVILKDVAYKDLEALLQFMYRGEVNVCQEELGGFLKTAEMLEVKGLTGDDNQRSSSPSNQMQQTQALQPKPSNNKDRTHISGKVVSAPMVLADDSRGILTSQFKRKRVSGPVSPATGNSGNDENMGTRGHTDYAELAHPKVEPRDIDGDEGTDGYNVDKDANDSLVTLLAGESSHGGIHAESMQGMDPTVFSSISVHGPSDSTGPQDASQVEYIRTEKGHLKLLLGGYMYTRHRVNNGTIEWRCDQRRLCTSRLWVTCGTNNVAKISPHSHPADYDRVKIAKLSRWVVSQDVVPWNNSDSWERK